MVLLPSGVMADQISDVNALGKDGRLDWIYSIAAHAEINSLLQWEVSTAQKKATQSL